MVFTRYLTIAGLALLPSLAFADVPPDADPYQACKGLEIDAYCLVSTFEETYEGACVEEDCPDQPGQKCNVCREPIGTTGTAGPETSGTAGPDTSGTAGPITTGEGTAGPITTGDTGSSEGTAGVATTGDGPTTGTATETATDAGSSSGDQPKDSKGGCDCRSSGGDASAGLLALLGLTLVRRRRRRA